jgi:outer membrane protein assembly factor BamB
MRNELIRIVMSAVVAVVFSHHALLVTDAMGGSPVGAEGARPSVDRPIGWRAAGDGAFPGANPPTHWSYGGRKSKATNVRWRTKLPGWGHSQPVVVEPDADGDPTRVFVTCDPHWLVCLDADTGETLWKRSISPEDALKAVGRKAKTDDRIGKDWYTGEQKRWRGYIGFSFATPVTDGKHVYVSFGQGQVACFDLTGRRVWANHISRIAVARKASDSYEHRKIAGPYCNFVPSPRLADDVLVVQSIGGVRGFDKATGKKLWGVEPYTWYYQCGTGIVLHLGK